MKNTAGFALLIILAVIIIDWSGCAAMNRGSGSSGSSSYTGSVLGAMLPPTGTVTRQYPKLVNYFQCYTSEDNVSQLEQRLGQWNVLIIDPDVVNNVGISLAKIRSVNPNIKILAWIPFGQSPDLTQGIGLGLPPASNPDNWFIKMVSGQLIVMPWGGYMMNPWKDNNAWPKYAINYLTNNYLKPGLYDGVMFDNFAAGAPSWAAADNPQTADINEDGVYDINDQVCWIQGLDYIIQILRENCPGYIFTGNGGVPWPADCPYFTNANGNMNENALGNEFGAGMWYGFNGSNPSYCYGVWDGYQSTAFACNPNNLTRYYFINADIRYNRDASNAQSLTALTPDDLRRMRVGLVTSMLLDCGYSGFDRGDCLHGQLWWFDEYNADMGSASGSLLSNVFGPETFGRAFQKGTVILNNNPTNITATFGAYYIDSTSEITSTVFIIPAYDARIFIAK